MKLRMILLGLVLGILLVFAFNIGQVYATTGCFSDTNGHMFETYICWMKENGITTGTTPTTYSPEDYVTRGQMAVFMRRIADIPPSTGLILVGAGNGDWKPFASGDNLSFRYFSAHLEVAKATTGQNFISVHPSLPSVLYGRNLQLVGVELCYQASVAASISYVEINMPSSVAGEHPQNNKFVDNTSRTDAVCRYYVLPSPVNLTAENTANIYISGSWTTAGASLTISRTTFVLQPTSTVAVAPSRPGAETVILRQVSPNEPSLSDPQP